MIPHTDKYRARVDELESLKQELEAPKRPGDPAPIIGRVLEAAGDLLRRSASTPCDAALIDGVLKLVPNPALASWGAAIEVDEVKRKLQRAASEAVEAAIPDGEDDGEAMLGWAMQDLMVRDRLESALVALERLSRAGRADATTLHATLQRALEGVDAATRASAPSLTALNAHRRAEAALLDASCRSRAWWVSARTGIDDDALVKRLGGEAGVLGEREAAAATTVSTKRRRTVSFDELFRFDMGLASPAETAVIRAQAERDPELKLAMAAMQQADAAIEELTKDEAPFTHAPVVMPVEQRTPPPEVVEERAEFKVLVFRSKQRVQVVVQPRRQDRFAAAAVYLDGDSNRPLAPQPGDHGLHFDLGPPERLLARRVRVMVKLTDGQSLPCEVRL